MQEGKKKTNAATDPGKNGAAFTNESTRGRSPCGNGYFLSVRGAVSSITHGQKFWGLRVAVAFLTTVIFMSLLRFG
jgi:hypothetical protein